MIFFHHTIAAAPLRWDAVAGALAERRAMLAAKGGALYGVWRSQIGRPRDELTAITVWSNLTGDTDPERILTDGVPDVLSVTSQPMTTTLRPADAVAPVRQGNYAFRWFETPEPNWDEFLSLCAQAWPGFEAAYDSQVIGLWRRGVTDGCVRSLLLTRRPDLAMWERSKIPQGAAETAVRDTLNRRYDLCTATVVYTTTLLTATDSADRSRWA